MRMTKLSMPVFDKPTACSTLTLEEVDDLFFSEPTDREKFSKAKEICDGCSGKAKCLTYAMSHPELEGIWAGTSKRMRERARTRMRRENAIQ